ncbi:MAG: hypothetical protein N4A61_01135 [Pelagimonas sp.]|jgi:hypothetical protein|nr:hypothetical protein [Pelagimonas sp.]
MTIALVAAVLVGVLYSLSSVDVMAEVEKAYADALEEARQNQAEAEEAAANAQRQTDDAPAPEDEPDTPQDVGVTLTESATEVRLDPGEDETGSLFALQTVTTGSDPDTGAAWTTYQTTLYLVPENANLIGVLLNTGEALPDHIFDKLGLTELASWDQGSVTAQPGENGGVDVSDSRVDMPELISDDQIEFLRLDLTQTGDQLVLGDLLPTEDLSPFSDRGVEALTQTLTNGAWSQDTDLVREGDTLIGSDADEVITLSVFDTRGIGVAPGAGADSLTLGVTHSADTAEDGNADRVAIMVDDSALNHPDLPIATHTTDAEDQVHFDIADDVPGTLVLLSGEQDGQGGALLTVYLLPPDVSLGTNASDAELRAARDAGMTRIGAFDLAVHLAPQITSNVAIQNSALLVA